MDHPGFSYALQFFSVYYFNFESICTELSVSAQLFIYNIGFYFVTLRKTEE